MSDEIHPNLDGHKLIAEEIVQAIIGRRILLKDIPVSTPFIPWTRGKLQKKQPIHVLAMPPFDAQIKVAIRRIYPNADIKVTTWETAGKSLSDIEEQSKTIRKMAPDLVVIAVPIETTSSSREQYVRTYSWILNYALSFGLRTWDVIAIDPALASEPSSPEQRTRARLVQQLIRAQDLPFVKRPEDNSTPAGAVLKQWVAEQLGKPNTR